MRVVFYVRVLKIHMKYRRPFFDRLAYSVGALLFASTFVAPSALAATSNYTWTDSSTTDTATHNQTWNGMASSASGKYAIAGEYLGDVWTSNDYGISWTDTTDNNPSMRGYNWTAAAMSASGQHAVIAAYNGDIYTSNDYGATWTDRSTGHAELVFKHWFTLTSDSTGKRLVAAIFGGDIYTSNDYGATWTDRSAVAPATAGLEWWDLAVSTTGQRLTALTHNGDIYTSNDYGASWTNVSETTASETHGLNLNMLAMSGTGQYQAVTIPSNGIWTSNDYGTSWVRGVPATGQTWTGVRLSGDGRRAIAAVSGGDIWTGINPAARDSAIIPNDADANDDGTPDYLQTNIAGSQNPVTSTYAAVQADANCSVSDQSVVSVSSVAGQDTSYTYPAGLMDFTVQGCGANGFTTTVTQYYYGVTGSNFVLRKYSPATKQYTTVSDATIAPVTIGGQNAIKATYQVTDGGSLDQDGTANGVIVDPAGLATPISGTLTDTGSNVALTAAFAGTLIVLAAATRYSFRRK